MELLLASGIGLLTTAGVYLILRLRTFPVIVGTALLSYAVNLFLFSSGRLARNLPPIIDTAAEAYSDPLPQALVLTAIVISFGMTAMVVLIGLGAFLESDTDSIDIERDPVAPDPLLPPEPEALTAEAAPAALPDASPEPTVPVEEPSKSPAPGAAS